MTLLYPYQYLKKVTPIIYRIGVSDLLKYKLKIDYKKDNRFILDIKDLYSKVYAENVSSNLHNHRTNTSYLFFSPYDGIIVDKNYALLCRPDFITRNTEEDNWLFDIRINCNHFFNTYS
jgi:glycine cleavage system H lipoate-binding protein